LRVATTANENALALFRAAVYIQFFCEKLDTHGAKFERGLLFPTGRNPVRL
jgi:hypothetical protein